MSDVLSQFLKKSDYSVGIGQAKKQKTNKNPQSGLVVLKIYFYLCVYVSVGTPPWKAKEDMGASALGGSGELLVWELGTELGPWKSKKLF